MSKKNVIQFFNICANNERVLQKFNRKSLPELLFHARSMGFNFSQEELQGVIGPMEVQVIMGHDGEEINANSSLWPRMWGKPRFQYVIDDLYRTLSEDELAKIAN